MIVIVDHDYSLPNVCLDVYFFTIPTFQLPENSEKISGDTIGSGFGFQGVPMAAGLERKGIGRQVGMTVVAGTPPGTGGGWQ
jgi:hypothetical protein